MLWLYQHNPAGQIASVNRDNEAYAWTGHYAVNRNYTTNGLNQYTAAGGATFGYDLNGNLTSDGIRTYLYDIENRMVGGNGATLAYDPLGRLYQVTASGGGVTRFLYDGDALVAEYDGAGAMTRRYAHWDGADVPVISYATAALASPSYLHTDHQGSIVALSGAAGTPVTINTYDEYGIPGVNNAGRFQYTGQVWLPELGLYYYKARIYSPTLGRFMQTDPVGYQGGINLYAYVGNDPVNSTDPSGMLKCGTDERCGEVHRAARQARQDALTARRELRGLARAIRNNDTLTSRQSSLLATHQRKFGPDTSSPAALERTANQFGRIASAIGTPGNGMQVAFGSTEDVGGGPAATSADGRTLTLGPKFFGYEGGIGMGLTRAFTILHEGGHGAGLRDTVLPQNAPPGYGRFDIDGWRRAYGSRATDWLGANLPFLASDNNDSFACIANPNCGP